MLDRLRAILAEQDRGLAAALEGAALVERSGSGLRIAVPEPFAARRLERRLADLETLCGRLFGRPTRVAIEGPPDERPEAGAKDQADADRVRRRREALGHPAVNAALEILGGEVVEIRPLGGGGRDGGAGR